MNPEITQLKAENKALQDRLTKLETLFRNHKHLEWDGSKELNGGGLNFDESTNTLSVGDYLELDGNNGAIRGADSIQIIPDDNGGGIGHDVFIYAGEGSTSLNHGSIYLLPKGNAMPTDATGGFVIIGGINGVPTGVPTNVGGLGGKAITYDYVNNDLYVYNSGWKKVHLA